MVIFKMFYEFFLSIFIYMYIYNEMFLCIQPHLSSSNYIELLYIYKYVFNFFAPDTCPVCFTVDITIKTGSHGESP